MSLKTYYKRRGAIALTLAALALPGCLDENPSFDDPAPGPVYADGEHPDLRRRERGPPTQEDAEASDADGDDPAPF